MIEIRKGIGYRVPKIDGFSGDFLLSRQTNRKK
jgi:hypothetical protein